MTSTFLFPIPLQGAQSFQIESFPSYLHRLAYAHAMHVGAFLKHLHDFAIAKNVLGNIHPLPHYINVEELIRPGQTTLMLIELIQKFTDQELEAGILWIFESCLSRPRGEVVAGFRWCPECIAEMLNVGITPYFMLIWHMSAITACPIHRTPFAVKCEFCECRQTSYIKKVSMGFCQDCGKSLSNRRRKLRPLDIINSWEDIGLDVVALFKDTATLPPNSFPSNGIHKSIEEVFNHYWKANREEEFYNALSRDEMLAIVYKQTPISFKSARKIAYRLGISLFALLSGDASQTSDSLDCPQLCVLPPGYLEACKKTKKDHMVILNRIKVELKNSKTPPSLNRLSKKVGVSVGYLEYRHPTVVTNVVTRHRNYEEKMKLNRLHRAQSSALNFFLAEKYQTQTKSRKQAYRVLREETGLPKFMLKRAIQVAFAAIHRPNS